jgi:hypothetical protein
VDAGNYRNSFTMRVKNILTYRKLRTVDELPYIGLIKDQEQQYDKRFFVKKFRMNYMLGSMLATRQIKKP